jgi:amino acid adenylation domain-containing protein
MDDMLKCRGQKVSPKELEDIISRMAGIKEVAVIGQADTEESDAIHLHIAAFEGVKIDEPAVREYCRKNLTSHQQPKFIHFHNSLPKSENGKLNKRLLRVPASLNELILETVRKYPQRSALWTDHSVLNFSELNLKAKHCASIISAYEGPSCALLCARGEALYVGLLASLYAGKAYVPFSPRIPVIRNQVMLEESKAEVVILNQSAEPSFRPLLEQYAKSLTVILYDYEQVPEWANTITQHSFICPKLVNVQPDFEPVAVLGSSPAYLLFTSGSTGKPKGVMVSHSNMLAYYQNGLEAYKPCLEDRFAQVTELTFDLSMHDIFLAWGTGAALYALPDSLYGSLSFYLGVIKFVQQHQLTFWMSVPSTGSILRQLGMLRENLLTNLRCTVFCGEPLSTNMAKAWQLAAPNTTIYNLYGPTEATIGFTYYIYHHGLPDNSVVPIGRAFSTQHTAILDLESKPVGDNEAGELCLAGQQVVEGYWHNPDKTKERFSHMIVNGVSRHWYRTGDVVKMDAEGIIHYMGRIDDQLQIRGSRVEKLEIETILRRISGTDSVAVLPWPFADDGTVLGVVSFISGSPMTVEEIMSQAKAEMPEYMLPKTIYFIDALPLNQNGKTDYKALQLMLRSDSKETA